MGSLRTLRTKEKTYMEQSSPSLKSEKLKEEIEDEGKEEFLDILAQIMKNYTDFKGVLKEIKKKTKGKEFEDYSYQIRRRLSK